MSTDQPWPGAGSAFAKAGAKLLHTMLRVRDLDRSLGFYVGHLGMKLLRRVDFVEGQYTLAFVGYTTEQRGTVLELTHNWDGRDYQLGTAYGHIAIGVPDARAAAAQLASMGVRILRPAGPLDSDPAEIIAFVADPDGYRVELIERPGLSEPEA